MKNTISSPPRKLSWPAGLIIFYSHIYARPGSYYSLSEYALFVQSFAEAEQAARKAVELASTNTNIYHVHLPAALLFQGRIAEAKAH